MYQIYLRDLEDLEYGTQEPGILIEGPNKTKTIKRARKWVREQRNESHTTVAQWILYRQKVQDGEVWILANPLPASKVARKQIVDKTMQKVKMILIHPLKEFWIQYFKEQWDSLESQLMLHHTGSLLPKTVQEPDFQEPDPEATDQTVR